MHTKKATISEIKGVIKPNTPSPQLVQKIKDSRNKQPSVDAYITKITEGNTTYLSKAITLIESTNAGHQELAAKIIERCLPYANNALRIGITGVPGVGKSTFIEAFGTHCTSLGKKVAVLAVDPSSTVHKGSILGDKTRMEHLVANPNAFIRPSPSSNTLGGVGRKTRESILLCEAAGYDTIIIETVGVGQSETMVHSMVDFFLLLKLAGAGDELQGIKRGIIEMADAIIIHKADGDNQKNATIAQQEFTRALHLYLPKESCWQPKVLLASGLHKIGITEVSQMIDTYLLLTKGNNYFYKHRKEQNIQWFLATMEAQIKAQFYASEKVQKELTSQIKKIEAGRTTPFYAAQSVLAIVP